MKKEHKWLSPVPAGCDICKGKFGKYFYDANTSMGWGLICDKCFKKHGKGLGIGFGQQYLTKTRIGIAGFEE